MSLSLSLGDLLDRVEQVPSGCWEWTGARHKQGYGEIYQHLAHRAVYQIVHGLTDEQMLMIPAIRHTCDNPPCVNPLHLVSGTQGENIEDYLRRGRARERRGNPHNAKLTEEIVTDMRKRARAGERSIDLAREYGITRSCASQAIRGSTWRFIDEPPFKIREA